MVSPAVMFIETAADSLKDRQPWLVASQLSELQSFGDERAEEIGATGLTDDFKKGYELGLQTARVLLMGMPAAVLNKVEI